MVQIIEENRRPSFGQQFAKGLGTGLSHGLSQSAEMAQKMALQKVKGDQKSQFYKSLLGAKRKKGMLHKILKKK